MSIEDSGIGIDPEEGKALFSRFRQIDSAVERENPVALTAGQHSREASHYNLRLSLHLAGVF